MEMQLLGIRLNSSRLGKMLHPLFFLVVQLWLLGQGLPMPPIVSHSASGPHRPPVPAMSPCCRGLGGLCCPPATPPAFTEAGWPQCQRSSAEGNAFQPVPPVPWLPMGSHVTSPVPSRWLWLDVQLVPGLRRGGPGARPHGAVWLLQPQPLCARAMVWNPRPRLCPGRQRWLSSASVPRCLRDGAQAGCCCPKFMVVVQPNTFLDEGSSSRDGIGLAAPLGSIPSRICWWPHLLFTHAGGREGRSPCGRSQHKAIFPANKRR